MPIRSLITRLLASNHKMKYFSRLISANFRYLHFLKKWRAEVCGIFIFCILFSACQKEEDQYVYPSIIKEFTDLISDQEGKGILFMTDSQNLYSIQSPIEKFQPNGIYRVVCGYETTGEYNDTLPVAKVYQLYAVEILAGKDEETPAGTDPTGVTAVWRSPRYINLQLMPKTQGGEQEWGYRTDSITPSSTGRIIHLSLFHNQADDPYAYSTTVYASLPLSALNLQKGDSLTFTIQTFENSKTWHFAY